MRFNSLSIIFCFIALWTSPTLAEELSFFEDRVAFDLPKDWTVVQSQRPNGNFVLSITLPTPPNETIPAMAAIIIRPPHPQATPNSFANWLISISKHENLGYQVISSVEESPTTISAISSDTPQQEPAIIIYERFTVTETLMANLKLGLPASALANSEWTAKNLPLLNTFISSLRFKGQKGTPYLVALKDHNLVFLPPTLSQQGQ